MRVGMIGSGYVGLVSGACFADFGYYVTCVDKDKIARLRKGEMPIFEPDLDRLLVRNTREKRLDCGDLSGTVAEADVVFIAVGTPSRRGDGHADLSYIHAAAEESAAALTGFAVVITNRPCRPATRSNALSGRPARTPMPRWFRPRNSCARAPRSSFSSRSNALARWMAELYRPLYL